MRAHRCPHTLAALPPLALALLSLFPGHTLAEEATLAEISVRENQTAATRYQLPQTTESVTAAQIADSVNVVDTEDALKYLPSLFVRKRNYGDTQPVLATRTWGVNASARSLVYADGVLLSALVANNNSIGAPRWGLVAPEEIERIDVLYGPFSAAYAGNSLGAVVDISTRMPRQFEATVSQMEAWQDFNQYGTHDTYRSSQTAATLGNRDGDLSWWFSFNHQDSHSQPLSYVTATTQPAGTTGGYGELNKTGGVANVYGASGLLHTVMDNAKVKLAYDLDPAWRVAYTYGFWSNDGHAGVDSYLRTAAGAVTYGNQAGFGSGQYTLQQQHDMHSLSLKSDTGGTWDWEAVATRYSIDHDIQRTPNTVGTGTSLPTAGRITLLEGTGWNTQDLKGIWRSEGRSHELSFGYHRDHYQLVNATYTTNDWANGRNFTGRASEGNGKTETQALWLQDAWRLASDLKTTLGGRWEKWRAFDGYNYSSSGSGISTTQPTVEASHFSPKASLAWEASPDWLLTTSVGKAYRFPTAAELYQLVTSGAQSFIPNPNLKPENVLSTEMSIERSLSNGKLRLSLFNEDVSDALIGQTTILNGANTTVTMNVDKVRTTGFELAAQQTDALFSGLDLSGSLTYAYSKIISNPGWQATSGTTSTGKFTPYVPDWRATLSATYRTSDKLSTTLSARYSGKMYSTMDNTDVHDNTYQGFSGFFVIDAKLRYQVDAHWVASVGIDNLNNYKYTLFHPFPQRTLVANLKYSY